MLNNFITLILAIISLVTLSFNTHSDTFQHTSPHINNARLIAYSRQLLREFEDDLNVLLSLVATNENCQMPGIIFQFPPDQHTVNLWQTVRFISDGDRLIFFDGEAVTGQNTEAALRCFEGFEELRAVLTRIGNQGIVGGITIGDPSYDEYALSVSLHAEHTGFASKHGRPVRFYQPHFAPSQSIYMGDGWYVFVAPLH